MTAVLGDFDARSHAIAAIGEWGDVEAFEFLANELQDRTLLPAIRRDVLSSMKHIDPVKSMPYLIASLAVRERLILESLQSCWVRLGCRHWSRSLHRYRMMKRLRVPCWPWTGCPCRLLIRSLVLRRRP